MLWYTYYISILLYTYLYTYYISNYYISIPYYFLIFLFYNTFIEIKLLKYYLEQIVEKRNEKSIINKGYFAKSHSAKKFKWLNCTTQKVSTFMNTLFKHNERSLIDCTILSILELFYSSNHVSKE